MMAALLSAVMSSADTTLLTASIIISDPISKGLDTNNSLLNTRLIILGLGGLSILLALEVTSIIQVLLIALAVFSGAFIVPTAAGLLGFRTSERKSTMAMAAGSILALAGKVYSLYGDRMIGNWIIISAFAVNALILFSGRKKRDVRHQTQDARQ
jgi:SSS family solute:Na+ symporter